MGAVVNRTSGNHYLITGGLARVAVADVDRGRGRGASSARRPRGRAAVRYSFIEAMALSMLARSRGYFVLHAAGVVRNGIAGWSSAGRPAAGKSTLAMACARRGFGVFAEDAVFVRVRPASIELWGMPWVQRLLPDARTCSRSSPGCRTASAERRVQDRGRARRRPPGSGGPVRRARPDRRCSSRGDGGPTRIEPVEGRISRRLEVHWPWDGGWTDAHERGAARAGAHGVYRLHMNGTARRGGRRPRGAARRAGARRRDDDPSDAVPRVEASATTRARLPRRSWTPRCASWRPGSRAGPRRSLGRGVVDVRAVVGVPAGRDHARAGAASRADPAGVADRGRRPGRRRSTGSPGRPG